MRKPWIAHVSRQLEAAANKQTHSAGANSKSDKRNVVPAEGRTEENMGARSSKRRAEEVLDARPIKRKAECSLVDGRRGRDCPGSDATVSDSDYGEYYGIFRPPFEHCTYDNSSNVETWTEQP